MVIYLGCLLPNTSSGSPKPHNTVGTALHARKDLAVSLSLLPRRLFPKEAFGFRRRRLCSHLARTALHCEDGCYPLQFLIILGMKNVSGLSSPLSL